MLTSPSYGSSLVIYFPFQPMLNDWYNTDCSMCYPVCVILLPFPNPESRDRRDFLSRLPRRERRDAPYCISVTYNTVPQQTGLSRTKCQWAPHWAVVTRVMLSPPPLLSLCHVQSLSLASTHSSSYLGN